MRARRQSDMLLRNIYAHETFSHTIHNLKHNDDTVRRQNNDTTAHDDVYHDHDVRAARFLANHSRKQRVSVVHITQTHAHDLGASLTRVRNHRRRSRCRAHCSHDDDELKREAQACAMHLKRSSARAADTRVAMTWHTLSI